MNSSAVRQLESMGLPTAFSSSRTSRRPPHHGRNQVCLPYIRAYFDKRFFLPRGSGLPPPADMYKSDAWQDPKLQNLKNELNAVKNKLNDFDLAEWHAHTLNMNLAGGVVRTLRHQVRAEFVTQAWCKFYEIVSTFKLVPPEPEGGRFNSVHLCEAPGAFVAALNHYLKLNRRVQWRWIATTLNPYHEGNSLSHMINDDRFLLQTLECWDFGSDQTGDLGDLHNMWHLVERSRREMGDVHLVTADGSIDCQENPGEQERMVSGLHLCETVAALHILAAGGSFLLKLFTTFEHESTCLVYLLSCAFQHVEAFKPATSREGNSEVYLVCLGYRGAPSMEPWLEVFRRRYGESPSEKAMFPREQIPRSFMSKLYHCANYFKKRQARAIERNIETFTFWDAEATRDLLKVKDAFARHFVARYQLTRLDDSDRVVAADRRKEWVPLNMAPKSEAGTFSSKRSLVPVEQLTEVFREALYFPQSPRFEGGGGCSVQFPADAWRVRGGLSLVTGRRVSQVRSSKFCSGSLLSLKNKVLELTGAPGWATRPMGGPMVLRTRMGLDASNTWELDLGCSDEASAPLSRLLGLLREVPAQGNLALLRCSMLTQLRVGLIYLLAHMFHTVTFWPATEVDGIITFVGRRLLYVESELMSYLEDVAKEMDGLRDHPNLAVLSVVAVDRLCGNHDGDDGSFYGMVSDFNNEYVRQQVLDACRHHLPYLSECPTYPT